MLRKLPDRERRRANLQYLALGAPTGRLHRRRSLRGSDQEVAGISRVVELDHRFTVSFPLRPAIPADQIHPGDSKADVTGVIVRKAVAPLTMARRQSW